MKGGHEARIAKIAHALAGLGATKALVRSVIEEFREALLDEVKEHGRAEWPTIGVFCETTRKGRRVFRIGFAAGSSEYIKLPPTVKLTLRASKFQRRHLVSKDL